MIPAREQALALALARWEKYSFTGALRAVDAGRIAAEVRNATDGPLRGLLFSVKDLFPVAGVESCAGSLLLAGWVPDEDAALIARLRAAGAVVFGKGVCAEFGFGVDTENRLDGRVLHFADASVSPGGSSGGDAVAVGAGIVDFAIAGDYGGSIRWPAQAAGVLGLRLGTAHPLAGATATGRIGLLPPPSCPLDEGAPRMAGTPGIGTAGEPMASGSQQAELETAGIMARSPWTLRAVLAAVADGAGGGEARDRSLSPSFSPSAAPRPGSFPSHGRPRNLRLLVSDGTEVAPVRAEVTAVVKAAMDAAARGGHYVVPAPDGLRDALRDALAVYTALRAATDDHQEVRRLAAGREELLCGSTVAVLDYAERTVASADPAEVSLLRSRASSIRAAVRAELSAASADALLMPLAASGPIGFGARVRVAGRKLDATGLMAHLRAVSLTGLPALAVPFANGLSVQLVGGDGGEDLLCAAAGDLMAAA
jgi:amidase